MMTMKTKEGEGEDDVCDEREDQRKGEEETEDTLPILRLPLPKKFLGRSLLPIYLSFSSSLSTYILSHV